jgi:predicted DNA-binding transcriptional regulator YafY
MLRRKEVVQLLRRYDVGHGVQARMARELGVSKATISRDIAALWASGRGCPCCGAWSR